MSVPALSPQSASLLDELSETFYLSLSPFSIEYSLGHVASLDPPLCDIYRQLETSNEGGIFLAAWVSCPAAITSGEC
jgi:hypothetical protein